MMITDINDKRHATLKYEKQKNKKQKIEISNYACTNLCRIFLCLNICSSFHYR